MSARVLRSAALCLLVGLAMGALATVLLRDVIGFSPFIITIPAAFAPFVTDSLRRKDGA